MAFMSCAGYRAPVAVAGGCGRLRMFSHEADSTSFINRSSAVLRRSTCGELRKDFAVDVKEELLCAAV